MKSSVSLLLGILVIGSHSLHGQPNLTTPAVCSGFTSNDMTLTYNGSTGSCSYYTFSFTYDPNITNLEWEIWSSGKNSYNSYMNYCDAVDGSPANYTFSFKGWYLIRLIITFSDNSTCQVYKYLNVNGSNMINCQPNPDEADVARPRVNINYSDPCYNSNNQLRGGLISFAGDPLAPCTNESKISYYLNYIDCDGVTHCDEPIGYTLGYSSCFNIAFGTVFIVEAVGNHCCYPDGYKRYLTIRYESILEDQDADPYAILITGNNCYDACTQWHANCTTGNWFYVDTIGVRTNHTGVNYPSSCSPYFTAGNDALQERERDNFENLYSDNLRFTGLEIEFGSSTEIQAVEIFDLLGRRIPGSFDISQNTYKLTERVNGVIIINLKTKNRNLVRKLIAF